MKPILENSFSSFYPDLKEDAERLHFAITAAGLGIWELNPSTSQVMWDDRCRELFGLARDNKLPYTQAIQYIHTDDLQAVTAAVEKALRGEDNGKYDMRYRTIGADDRKLRWVHFSGQAYFDKDGQVTRFGGIAQDITEYTLAMLRSESALQQSEYRFRTVISSASAGIGVFLGRELIIDMPNQAFIDIVGKGQDIEGKPLAVVMPELQHQPFLQILDEVYTTGKMFSSSAAPVTIVQNGAAVVSYYNVTFSPLLNNEGEVYGILDISIDVTEMVKARQKLEEAQNILQDAVELAQLATWTIDAKTGQTEYSERMKSWLGVIESTRYIEKGLKALPDHERERVKKEIEWAMNPKSGGMFDLEYGVVNQITGRERIIHSQARTFFDEAGNPIKVVGTALDVTQQRNQRLTLEHEVQLRTEELDAANEELKAANEELQTINEELAELNERLEQSNENLQQFAHVASHDLKEPIRKIKTFLGMIQSDPETVLSSKTDLLLQRVNASTDRMFSMINGVLNFSTINASEHPIGKVSLQETVTHIIQDLDMLIGKKKANIKYAHLPVIEGAEMLIYQLFSNLIINSLKFSKPDNPPVITFSSSLVNQNHAHFVKITVADNGLGFAPHQSEQIFNMFARLHSKDKFEGTGLGLSLCKKIVSRHGGSIEASGKVGEGAVFTIMLPMYQALSVI